MPGAGGAITGGDQWGKERGVRGRERRVESGDREIIICVLALPQEKR